MSILGKVKTNLNIVLGRISNLKLGVKIAHQWYGNNYGGFYVHKEKLGKHSIIYSFGVGEDISFDEELIKEFRCKVFAFDPTPKSITWVNNRENPKEFNFFPYGIDDRTGVVEFLLPKNDNYVSGSVINQKNVDEGKKVSASMKCLTDIVQELGHRKVDVLKMDIEGSEYKVLDSILAAPVEIDQILIEIHERFFPDGKERTKKMVETLKSNGYELFGISEGREEISFIKVR